MKMIYTGNKKSCDRGCFSDLHRGLSRDARKVIENEGNIFDVDEYMLCSKDSKSHWMWYILSKNGQRRTKYCIVCSEYCEDYYKLDKELFVI